MDAPKQTTVRAAVIPAPGALVEVRAFPRPDLEDGAALLRIEYSEVCGTDLHLQQGLLAATPYPLSPNRKVYGIPYGANEGLLGGWSECVYLKPAVRIIRLPDALSSETVIGGGCGLPTRPPPRARRATRHREH